MPAKEKTIILSYETAHELLLYNSDTGEFIRKVSRKQHKAGTIAGSISPDGYWVLFINGNKYQAHRIAWLMHYGEYPKKCLDHINRNRLDNRIVNLREVTNTENAKNKTVCKKSSSGLIGVCWHKAAKKWNARIRVGCKRIDLGVFTSKDDAYAAYVRASLKYYPQINGGFMDSEIPEYIRLDQ